MKITQSYVNKLKREQPPVGGAGYQIYLDDQIKNFGVRITAAGAISFVLGYSVNGRRHRMTLGQFPAMSADAARDAALAELVNIREAKGDYDPLAQKAAERTAPLVSDLAADYIKSAEKRKRESSVRQERQMLKNIILPELGALRVHAVTRRDIEKLHASLRSTPFHANRVRSLLSAMYTMAIEDKLCESNPVKGVKKYDEPKRENWLSIEQLRDLSAALDAYADQEAASAIRLLILTGSREMEVLSAEWKDFDLKRGTWTKPSHHTKQKRTEHVPLHRDALKVLLMMQKDSSSEYVFPGAAGSHRVTLRRPWKQVCRAAGLCEAQPYLDKRGIQRSKFKPLVRLHDLRHTFASHLVSSGQSLYLVGKLLGHTSASTTQRYAHCNDESLRLSTNAFPQLSQKIN